MTLRWMTFFTAPPISCHRCIDLFLPGALITTPGLMLMAGFSNKSMKIHPRILPFFEALCQGDKSSLRATCFWDSSSTRTAAGPGKASPTFPNVGNGPSTPPPDLHERVTVGCDDWAYKSCTQWAQHTGLPQMGSVTGQGTLLRWSGRDGLPLVSVGFNLVL